MKPIIYLDDPKTRRIWETCLRASEDVDAWPSWKRSEDVGEERPPLPAPTPQPRPR